MELVGLQLDLSTTPTLGTEERQESGRCEEGLNKGQCKDSVLSAGMKKSGRCREVAVSRGLTVPCVKGSVLSKMCILI